MFRLDYIATVSPTVSLVADTYGRRNVGIVYGWISFSLIRRPRAIVAGPEAVPV
jgi:hypothetical protein